LGELLGVMFIILLLLFMGGMCDMLATTVQGGF